MINTLFNFCAVFYMFFSAIFNVALMPLRNLVDGYTLNIANPFNTDVWTLQSDGFSTALTGVFNWIYETFNISADTTILTAMLFVVGGTLFVLFFVKFLVGIFS